MDNKVNISNIDCKDLLDNYFHIKNLKEDSRQVILEANNDMMDLCRDNFMENVIF